jgi:hypothetical protein
LTIFDWESPIHTKEGVTLGSLSRLSAIGLLQFSPPTWNSSFTRIYKHPQIEVRYFGELRYFSYGANNPLWHQVKRLESALQLANPEYLRSTESIRARIKHPNMPSESALSEHVERLKPGWLATADLICENLRVTQTTRLFLKKGEVFAGNRAARAIFESAKKTLDIIDTWFGPKVFDMFEVSEGSVQIRLISDQSKPPTVQAYQDFKKQYRRAKVILMLAAAVPRIVNSIVYTAGDTVTYMRLADIGAGYNVSFFRISEKLVV